MMDVLLLWYNYLEMYLCKNPDMLFEQVKLNNISMLQESLGAFYFSYLDVVWGGRYQEVGCWARPN